MSTEKKGQNLWGLIVIAAILSGLSYWTYREVASDYMTVEHSHQMVQSLLENQTHFVRSYAAQIADFKKNLARTEEKLAEVESENVDLKGKVAMLDSVSALEEKIAQLEAANIQMKQDMQAASAASKMREDEMHAKLQELLAEQDFKSVAEGRAVLAKYKKKIREIKSRIRGFQIEDRNKEIAEQVKEDEARLSFGNNGFLLRNGQEAPSNTAWPPSKINNKNVQIDVTIVK